MTQSAIENICWPAQETWCADNFMQTVNLVSETFKSYKNMDAASMKFAVTNHLLMGLDPGMCERVVKMAYKLFDCAMNDISIPTDHFDQAVKFAEKLPDMEVWLVPGKGSTD